MINLSNQSTAIAQALADCRNEIVSQLVALNVFSASCGGLESDLADKQARLARLVQEIVKAESINNSGKE